MSATTTVTLGNRTFTLDRTKAVAIRTKAGTALTGITIHVTP